MIDIQTLSSAYVTSFQDLGRGILNFLPSVVVAVVIFALGWFVGAVIGRVVAQVIRSLKVDMALKHAGVEGVVNRAGFDLDAGAFVGNLVKWFIIVVFLIASFEVLHLDQVNMFLQQVVLLYLPQVIVAILILLVAGVVAEAAQNVVTGAAKAADVPGARFAGTVARWAIWIFAFLIALNQLGIGGPFLQTLFTGIVVAISLALGLAFGLGGQDAAGRFIEKMRSDMANRHN